MRNLRCLKWLSEIRAPKKCDVLYCFIIFPKTQAVLFGGETPVKLARPSVVGLGNRRLHQLPWQHAHCHAAMFPAS